ncbi:MAG: hypothetical protein J6Y85_05515 [Alphaproteobacteria bacterium]|nr:hypothetical protein [Alphaproteobacteria bacterium]
MRKFLYFIVISCLNICLGLWHTTADAATDAISMYGVAPIKCQTVGSHVSIAQIKSNYKNCSKCGTMQDSDGQKVYYCTCCGGESGATTCTSSQYIVNNQCKACPANATCNGTNATCKSGYTQSTRNGVVTCTATGTSEFISVSEESIDTDAPSCSNKQYLVGTVCTTCPTNATCDGTKFTCNSGYTEQGLLCVSVDEARLEQSQTLSNQVQAADMKTSSYKLGNKCQQGSHTSIDWIKKHFKNCTDCRTEDIEDGACSRVKGDHKHYYCYCDSCNDGTKTSSSSGGSSSSKKSSSSGKKTCKKQGSHNSIAWIQSKYKNCVNCGSQTGSNGEVVYYCQCGDGCKASSSSGSGSSSSSSGKKGTEKAIGGATVGAVVAGGLVGGPVGVVVAKNVRGEVGKGLKKLGSNIKKIF